MSPEKYRIPIDGRWELRDLYEFPHTYAQIYAVLYVLQEELPAARQIRRNDAFRKYPWRGGYSAVNWFSDLYYAIPQAERPQIISIQYASPGWIDLGVYVSVAVAIRQMLVAFSQAGRHLNDTYSQIQQGIHQRKLNETKLRKQELLVSVRRGAS
jgi:hypothetical protein